MEEGIHDKVECHGNSRGATLLVNAVLKIMFDSRLILFNIGSPVVALMDSQYNLAEGLKEEDG
jgi:hypothetical protein